MRDRIEHRVAGLRGGPLPQTASQSANTGMVIAGTLMRAAGK